MSKDKYSQLVVRINEYIADSLLLFLHGDNKEYSEKQDIVANI